MSRTEPFIVLTRDAVEKISSTKEASGRIRMRYVPSEEMYVVSAVTSPTGTTIPVDIPTEYRALRWGDKTAGAQWVRKPQDEINYVHRYLVSRPSSMVPFDAFREMVPGVADPGNNSALVITHDPDRSPEAIQDGVHEFAGWHVERVGVRPIRIEVEPQVVGLKQLADKWPIDQLAGNSIMIVGCGSIGGAVAEALAGYGVGRVLLVDPDRFLWHNMLRHALGPESVGRKKVDALKEHLNLHWPLQAVDALPMDVVSQAHLLRPLINDVDMVICAADGIAPRRVVSHLARRAKKPAIMACVLENGSIGELIRLRPTPRYGCLLCFRAHLEEAGAMDAEANQELDYGTGIVHQPMTAVPPDLRLMGTMAAKAAVATLLESLHGDHTQALPGEYAVIGLRPVGDLASPFDMKTACGINWATIPQPRKNCPTCGAA